MSAAVLLLVALVQGVPPELDAEVDRDRLAVGEELVYTVRATSRASTPMQVEVAPFNGLEVVARTERTEVSLIGGASRTTTLEVRLRALRPGRWLVGPARAVQGSGRAEAAAIPVVVDDTPGAIAAALNPRLQRLLAAAAPPRAPGRASVTLVVSSEAVRVGEQVDVLTAAWFPRELRLQLRRPPTLQPPVIDRVWSYPQPAPPGIAASRNVGGVWYDLFIAHQVVFPLVPGRLVVPPATLKYSVPLALQFFSQEERFAVASAADTVAVHPLPDEGRPRGFGGAVARGLRVERRWSPTNVRVGEGVAVELAIEGEGNMALWPAPELRWPESLRAYPDRVEDRVATTQGRLGGRKTFRFLVVPDSAGTLVLPAVEYPYFDLESGTYAVARAPHAALAVAPGGAAPSRPLPPGLLEVPRAALASRALSAMPVWGWALVALLPPIIAFARVPALRRSARARATAPPAGLPAAAGELDSLLAALVPDPVGRAGSALGPVLRAAGVDARLAARVVALRERLDAERFAPPDRPRAGEAQLAEEARAVAAELGGRARHARPTLVTTAILLALAAAARAAPAQAPPAQAPPAQAPPAERLYESGALRPAADAFFRRAADAPEIAAHWYNLGATYYRLGDEGRATAAWLRARRLAPREPAVRRALRLAPVPDETSSRWTWSPPVTPAELGLLAALAWVVGWLGWIARPARRAWWTAVLAAAALCAVAGLALRAWYRRPIAVVLEATPLRASPHGRAAVVEPLPPGSAVRVVRRSAGWVLVRAAREVGGWVPADALARLGG